MTKFKSLEVSEWRQFGLIEIDFHPQMTVITGANGAGKTTLLNILSQHFGWTQRFVGTLRIDRRGARRYYTISLGWGHKVCWKKLDVVFNPAPSGK